MTNSLVGDVYQKVIEEVVLASTNDFEESGVGQATLNELRQAWQQKLSQRGVAQMPWDPKPEPPQRMQNGASHAPPPLPQAHYQGYVDEASLARPIKVEPVDSSHVQSNGFVPPGPQQGGINRAQELVQEKFGSQAAAAFQRPGLTLTAPSQTKPQGLQLPGQAQAQAQAQQQYAQQMRQQQMQMNSHIKAENDSPTVQPGQYPPAQRAYAQTDGADDMAEWKSYISQRRAMHATQISNNDHFMRDQISAMTNDFNNGLMLPLDGRQRKQTQRGRSAQSGSSTSRVPQLDGEDDDDDLKPIKADEDDEDAINSDLDDPEDDQNAIGDDDDDLGDSILCTYDKVQRVKNKWKCTLKDGVLNTNGKEWLFHKGQGEFEW